MTDKIFECYFCGDWVSKNIYNEFIFPSGKNIKVCEKDACKSLLKSLKARYKTKQPSNRSEV